MRGLADPASLVISRNRLGEGDSLDRDADRRSLYLSGALADIPRLLGAVDRNP
jgi:hypothetical protein